MRDDPNDSISQPITRNNAHELHTRLQSRRRLNSTLDDTGVASTAFIYLCISMSLEVLGMKFNVESWA